MLISKDYLYSLGVNIDIILYVGVLCGLFNRFIFSLERRPLLFLCCFIFILSARTIWFGFEYSAYIMASIVAFSFNFDKAQYSKILTILAFVNLLLMSHEYLYQKYLYVYVASDGSILDEVLFGGHAEIFRAKGLFAGPLSAVAFAYVLLVIRRFDLHSFLIVLLTGFLTYGRLAILVGIIGVLLKIEISSANFFRPVAVICWVSFEKNGIFNLCSQLLIYIALIT